MSAIFIKSISAMEVCPLAEANIRAVFPSYTYTYTVINSSISSYACRPISMSMSMSTSFLPHLILAMDVRPSVHKHSRGEGIISI